jgi:predicted protein tyrosine phosphatase
LSRILVHAYPAISRFMAMTLGAAALAATRRAIYH